jgi:outer membrane protein TolC
MLQLSQPLPLGGKRRLQAEKARSEAQAAEADAASAWRDVEAAVARAYFDLYLAERTVAVDSALEKTLGDLREAGLARLRAGLGQQVDVLRLQSAQLELGGEEEMAQERTASATAQLNAFLDRSPTQALGPATEPGLLASLEAADQLQARALASREELKAAIAQPRPRARRDAP